MNFTRLFKTILNHRAYQQLLAEPQILVATGERFWVKANWIQPWSRIGERTASIYTYMTELEAIGYDSFGAGTSPILGESIQKSISEAYERLVYKMIKGVYGIQTSNGFAAHPNYKTAVLNGALEALERDAVLVHWLSRTPFLRIPFTFETSHGASMARALTKTPFRATHLLLSTRGYISTLTIVAGERWGEGSLVAHGAGYTIGQALDRALVELERLAVVTRDLLPLNPGFRREMHPLLDHSTFSENRLNRANWMLGEVISWTAADREWRSPNAKTLRTLTVQDFARGPVQVVRVSAPHLQDLFFGETEAKNVNASRVGTHNFNLETHFVA